MSNQIETEAEQLFAHVRAVINNAKGEHKRKVELCRTCPSLSKTTMICKECGCVTILKAGIPNQKCPLGKW